jgi:cold shock CspA family protein
MATGIVKFFDPVKAYGFIIQDDGSDNAFVHISGLVDGETITKDDHVEYEM